MEAPALLATTPVRLLATAAIAAPFVASGIGKLVDFPGAVAEAKALGLSPPAPVAAAVIAVQLGGAALLFAPGLAWIGAGLLAGFTLAATLIAHRWWTMAGPARRVNQTAFWEHAAIAGGLVLLAATDAGRAG